MPTTRLLASLLLAFAAPVLAAAQAEDDALSLADSTPETAKATTADWRAFTELSVGQVSLRQAPGRRTKADTQRFSIDLLVDKKLTPVMRAVLSDRLDLSREAGDAGTTATPSTPSRKPT